MTVPLSANINTTTTTTSQQSQYNQYQSQRRRPWIDLWDAQVASYILNKLPTNVVNSLENSTVRNSNGRIIKLKLDFVQDEDAPLPSEIEQLQELQTLELWGCKQLPDEIGNLFSMVSFKLIRCFGLQSLPSTHEMKSLTHLSINSLSRHHSNNNYFVLMTQIGRLPKLEVLALNYISFHSNDIEALLLQDDNAFRNTLVELNLYGNEVDHEGLNKLLWKVLPKFSKLTTIDLGRNFISSLGDTATAIKYNGDVYNKYSRLQKLHLKYNPIWHDTGTNHQKEPITYSGETSTIRMVR